MGRGKSWRPYVREQVTLGVEEDNGETSALMPMLDSSEEVEGKVKSSPVEFKEQLIVAFEKFARQSIHPNFFECLGEWVRERRMLGLPVDWEDPDAEHPAKSLAVAMMNAFNRIHQKDA